MKDIDKEITVFIETNINAHQAAIGLRSDLTIDSNIEETNIDDATLVNLLIRLESTYEIFFEDSELKRKLYTTLGDIKNVIVKKIKKKEEFLWGESLAF